MPRGRPKGAKNKAKESLPPDVEHLLATLREIDDHWQVPGYDDMRVLVLIVAQAAQDVVSTSAEITASMRLDAAQFLIDMGLDDLDRIAYAADVLPNYHKLGTILAEGREVEL